MNFYRFQSICTECGRPVPAAYVRKGGVVFLEKACPEHGTSRALASEDAEAFERWLAFTSVTVPPQVLLAEGQRTRFLEFHPEGQREKLLESRPEKQLTDVVLKQQQNDPECAEINIEILNTECPLHCGPCENHLMTACCVLLNVTARCNQHCPYCFAEAEQEAASRSQAEVKDVGDPSLTDVERWLERLVELGEERKFNIQLSGGEPTVRDDLPDIIRLCKEKGFEYVQLNTNGRRLAEESTYAKLLKTAGLSTVFMQFDGVDDEVYIALRGEPLLEIKKAAVRNCGAAGLPVSLVPTVLKSVNLSQTGAIIDFMLDHISVVKGVHFQPASFFGRRPDERNAGGDFDERVTMFAVMDDIEKQTGGRIRKADLAPISTGHPLCCFCAAFIKEPDDGLRPLSSGGSCCENNGKEPMLRSLSSGGSCCDSNEKEPMLRPLASDGSCCENNEKQPEQDPLEIIRRDRDFVMNKWNVSVPEDAPAGRIKEAAAACIKSEDVPADTTGDNLSSRADKAIMSFDEAIAMFKKNSFTISGMAFMDETNLDAERLRRCRVQVFTEDERLVPFCGYYTRTAK